MNMQVACHPIRCKLGAAWTDRFRMTVLTALTALTAALAACLLAGAAGAAEPAAGNSVPHASPGPALLTQVQRLIGPAACDSDAQCRTLPLGARACGGADAYVAWSVRGTDQAALRRAAERYSQWQAQQQARSSTMSICMVETDPGAVCSNAAAPDKAGAGRCVLGDAAAGSVTR